MLKFKATFFGKLQCWVKCITLGRGHRPVFYANDQGCWCVPARARWLFAPRVMSIDFERETFEIGVDHKAELPLDVFESVIRVMVLEVVDA